MFGFLKKAKEFVVTNAVAVKNAVTEEINEVMKESKTLEEQNQKEEDRQKNTKLPWEGLKLSSNANGNFTDLIKEEILALSSDEKNFLIDEENYLFEFDFNIENYKYQAEKVMEADPNLGLLRNKMVPNVIDDIKFWKTYFYQVEIIKMKYSNKSTIENKNVENEDNQLESEEFDVDIDKLEQQAIKESQIELGERKKIIKIEEKKEDIPDHQILVATQNQSKPSEKKDEIVEDDNDNLDIEIKL